MSTGNEGIDRQQQKVTEFLRLLPLTLEIAGLPKGELGRYFNEGQMELRVNTIKTAYRLARQLVIDVASKTTPLRMLLGLLQPTAGWATVAGFRSDQQPDEVKRRVGLVSATAGLYPHLSVREMLLFFADLYGCEAGQASAELDKLAEL